MSGARRPPGLGLIEILMRAYPRAFLARFGDSMRTDASQALNEARSRGRVAWLRTLAFWSFDATMSGIAERRSRRRVRHGSSLRSRWWFSSDVGHAIRRLRRAPGFSAVVALTLALGIGLTSFAFHVAYATVLRPLSYPASDRLVRITMLGEDGRELTKVSAPDLADWAEGTQAFDSFAGIDFGTVTFSAGASDPEVIRSAFGTPGVFEVLRVSARIGLLFGGEVGLPDGVVLSHAFWRTQFGGDPAITGRSVEIDGRIRTVIGVLPADFEDPATGEEGQAQVWLPLSADVAGPRDMRWLNGVARLADDVTLERATAELSAVAASLAAAYPEANGGLSVHVVPLRESMWGDATVPLMLLVGGTGFILLIACSNLASLLFARGATRRGELAIRRAIGAGRVDLVRQLAIETAVLAVAGGAVGLGLTWVASLALRGALDGRLPRMAAMPGAAVCVFGALLTLLAALFVGLVPGVRAARVEPGDALRESGRSGSLGRASRSLRSVLVGGQVALALVLMVGAALLLRSFDQLMRVDAGFEPSGLLVWELRLPSASYPDDAVVLQFESRLLEQLNAIPGTRAAAIDKLPFGTRWGCRNFMVVSRLQPERAEDWPCAESRSVSPGYAATLGMPLRRGRLLAETDDGSAEPVVIVNETFARQAWPQGEAIGQRIAWRPAADAEPVWRTVVGVVGDIRHRGLDVPPLPEVYMPYEQAPDRRMSYVVRATGADPTALVDAVRAAVREVDPRLPLRDLRTFESAIAESVAGLRTGVLSVLGLGTLALVLALTGIYGVVAYFVARRTPEIGLRIALGADPRGIVRLIIGEGMRTVVIGTAVGLLAALALARVMTSMLFDVRPTDPLSLAGVSLLMLAVATFACWLPARRALEVDPATALRNE